MNKYVVAFNGPPHSGKDTAAEILRKRFEYDTKVEVEIVKYAGILKQVVNDFCGIHVSRGPAMEALKAQPSPYNDDVTMRQAYINFSENYAKPTFGQDVFGKVLRQKMELTFCAFGFKTYLFIVSDAGFVQEQFPVIDYVGEMKYALFRMHREGCTFDGDSRSYIREGRLGGDIDNNGTLDDLSTTVNQEFNRIAHAGGWDV